MEKIGVERALKAIGEADRVLLVVDATAPKQRTRFPYGRSFSTSDRNRAGHPDPQQGGFVHRVHWPRGKRGRPRHHHPSARTGAGLECANTLKACMALEQQRGAAAPAGATWSATPGRAGAGAWPQPTYPQWRRRTAGRGSAPGPAAPAKAPAHSPRRPAGSHLLEFLHRQVMGLGPRRVVDNQGKVRSGSAYFPFTALPPALNHAGMDCRRAASSPRNHLRRCRSAWDGYPPGRGLCTGTALRSGVREGAALWSISICSPLERRIYPVVSPGAIATRRDVPCTQVNPVSGLSTSLEEILRKELLQTLDSVDTGQGAPPSAPKASHGEHSDTTAWRS